MDSYQTHFLLSYLCSFWCFLVAVPLRAPEISLTSRSPTDIQVSWLPIPAKFSRGRIVTYRLSYRVSSESAINTLEIPGAKSKHLIEGLDPDTIYLLRIAAATKIGWGEQSVWTSHRTPKASSAKGEGVMSAAPLVQGSWSWQFQITFRLQYLLKVQLKVF